jgi:hypothetical protein
MLVCSFARCVLLLMSVLLGRLAEGAAKKSTEMAVIRKSGIGCYVGD